MTGLSLGVRPFVSLGKLHRIGRFLFGFFGLLLLASILDRLVRYPIVTGTADSIAFLLQRFAVAN